MPSFTNNFVLPGEYIGTAEEFLPGEGTYDEDGRIYSAVVGRVKIDREKSVVFVEQCNPPLKLNVNDLVVGYITDIKGTLVIVNIVKVVGKKRPISYPMGEPAIHISKISEWFTRDIGKELKVGDFIKAKVIQVKPSVMLSTVEKNLGVIKAYCYRCRNLLELRNGVLYCKYCEKIEFRKVASDYGNICIGLRV